MLMRRRCNVRIICSEARSALRRTARAATAGAGGVVLYVGDAVAEAEERRRREAHSSEHFQRHGANAANRPHDKSAAAQ